MRRAVLERGLRRQIWHRLGLRLQYCGSILGTESPGDMVFSVQHPDLSSALVAPQGALSADFRSSSCHIDISPSKASEDGKRKRQKTNEARSRPQVLPGTTSDEEDLYRDLSSADRKAVEDFVQSINFGASSQVGDECGETDATKSVRLADGLTSSARVRDLVQAAIRMLVCGQRSSHKGLVMLGSMPSHALTNLAPAVFHIPYLKARPRR